MKEAFNFTLALYFSKMVTEFAISDKTYVETSVFNLNNLDGEQAANMWNDDFYGWKDYNTLVDWLGPVLS